MLTTYVWSLSAASPIVPCNLSHSQLDAAVLSWFRKSCAWQKRPHLRRRRREERPNWAGRRGSSDRAKHQISMPFYKRSVSLPCWICLPARSQIQKHRCALHHLSFIVSYSISKHRNRFNIPAMDWRSITFICSDVHCSQKETREISSNPDLFCLYVNLL